MKQFGMAAISFSHRKWLGLVTAITLCVGFQPMPTMASAQHHKMVTPEIQLASCLKERALPSPHCGRTPTPAFDMQGRLWLAFSQNGHVYVTSSSDNGESFSPAIAVNRTPETIYDDGENRPKIAFGPQGEIYLTWTRRTLGRYSGDIIFARALDGPKSFEEPIIVNTDRALISHRFETLLVDDDGRINILWIDKRDLAAAKATGQPYRGAALYYAASDDRGASFAFNKNLADHSCECCRIAATTAEDGKIAVMWRHVFEGQIRDHAIAYIGPNLPAPGANPIRATYDNWNIEGCPHHGPDIDYGGGDLIHMTWFTNGEGKEGLMIGRFNMVTRTLEVEHPLDNSPSASHPHILTVEGTVTVIWKRFSGENTDLLMKASHDAGTTWSEPVKLATTESGSDHPILISKSGELFASWHTQAEGYQLIPIRHGNAMGSK